MTKNTIRFHAAMIALLSGLSAQAVPLKGSCEEAQKHYFGGADFVRCYLFLGNLPNAPQEAQDIEQGNLCLFNIPAENPKDSRYVVYGKLGYADGTPIERVNLSAVRKKWTYRRSEAYSVSPDAFTLTVVERPKNAMHTKTEVVFSKNTHRLTYQRWLRWGLGSLGFRTLSTAVQLECF